MGLFSRRGLLGLMALILTVGLGHPASAQPTFTVEGVGREPTKLSLSLEPGTGVSRPMLLQVARAVQRSLHITGYFSVSILPPGQSTASTGWNAQQTAIPVTLAVEQATSNSRKVEVVVKDGSFGRPDFRQQFLIESATENEVGYASADVIYSYFIQRPGYFSSRLLYVRTTANRRYEIVSSDIFGEGVQVLVSSRYELSAPRITPDKGSIVYIGIRNDRPQIFTKRLNGGQETPLFNDRAIRFSLNVDAGGNVYYTKVVSGNSDIYRTPLGSRQEQRLTRGPSIETAPSVSPDGSKLAYVSDASGKQRIVVRDLVGGSTRVIGSSGFNYGSPSWSPDGKFIALSRQSRGTFSIAVVDMQTGEEKLISTSYFEEHPVWAANGSVLIFERGGGSAAGLWHGDIDTNNIQRLPIGGSARDPSWIR